MEINEVMDIIRKLVAQHESYQESEQMFRESENEGSLMWNKGASAAINQAIVKICTMYGYAVWNEKEGCRRIIYVRGQRMN